MKTLTTSVLGVLVLFAAVALLATFQARYVGAAGSSVTHIDNATTTASIAVTSSTRLLATSTSATDGVNSHPRLYATICNPNANPVFLLLNNDAPASNAAATAIIAAAAGYNTCYEITDRNQYNGSITASSTNQTSTSVIVSDYVR